MELEVRARTHTHRQGVNGGESKIKSTRENQYRKAQQRQEGAEAERDVWPDAGRVVTLLLVPQNKAVMEEDRSSPERHSTKKSETVFKSESREWKEYFLPWGSREFPMGVKNKKPRL